MFNAEFSISCSKHSSLHALPRTESFHTEGFHTEGFHTEKRSVTSALFHVTSRQLASVTKPSVTPHVFCLAPKSSITITHDTIAHRGHAPVIIS